MNRAFLTLAALLLAAGPLDAQLVAYSDGGQLPQLVPSMAALDTGLRYGDETVWVQDGRITARLVDGRWVNEAAAQSPLAPCPPDGDGLYLDGPSVAPGRDIYIAHKGRIIVRTCEGRWRVEPGVTAEQARAARTEELTAGFVDVAHHFVNTASQGVAPIELQPGEQITISAAECPPPPACPGSCGDGTCEPAESCSCPADCAVPPTEIACTGGIDEDCDGDVDCQDHDCMGDPACLPPPSGGSPPAGNLIGRYRFDVVHATEPGVEPAQTIPGCDPPNGCSPAPVGAWAHHLPCLPPASCGARELTEKEADWAPTVLTDAILLDGTDQLLFERCTSLDPLVCEAVPWITQPGDTWAVAFVGSFSGPHAFVGNPMEGGNLSIIDQSAAGHLRIRMQSSGRVTISTAVLPWNTPHTLVIEYVAGWLRAWRRAPCGQWAEITTGTPFLSRVGTWGGLSEYYPNGWINDLGAEEPHYPGFGKLREVDFYHGAYDRAGLFDYLEEAHGAWIDQGCGG